MVPGPNTLWSHAGMAMGWRGAKDGIFAPAPHGFYHPISAPPHMMGKITSPIPTP